MERGNHPDDDDDVDDDGGKLFGGTGDCIGMNNENNSLPHGDHHGLAIAPSLRVQCFMDDGFCRPSLTAAATAATAAAGPTATIILPFL